MLQELAAKGVLDELAKDDELAQRIPGLKDASALMKQMRGGEADSPEEQKSPRALMVGSSMLAGYGLIGLGQDILLARRGLVHMLMTDDEFAKEFRGGQFKPLHDAHSDEYIRHSMRDSRISNVASDMMKSWQKSAQLAEELAKAGVSRLDAIKQYRVGRQIGMLRDAGAVVAGASGWAHAIKKQREQRQIEPDSPDTPQHFR